MVICHLESGQYIILEGSLHHLEGNINYYPGSHFHSIINTRYKIKSSFRPCPTAWSPCPHQGKLALSNVCNLHLAGRGVISPFCCCSGCLEHTACYSDPVHQAPAHCRVVTLVADKLERQWLYGRVCFDIEEQLDKVTQD